MTTMTHRASPHLCSNAALAAPSTGTAPISLLRYIIMGTVVGMAMATFCGNRGEREQWGGEKRGALILTCLSLPLHMIENNP